MHPARVRKILTSIGSVALLGVVFVLVSNLSIQVIARKHIFETVAEAPTAGVVLIPGAAVLSDGKPSPIFMDRVEVGLRLYQAGKVSKILVSGDNSTVEYNEVNPVRVYLLNQGVPDTDIFLDHAGFDTYSSMYRARDVFDVTSVVIATQLFHLPRAVFVARALGLEASGLNADKGSILSRNYWRELFATQKMLLDLILHREPKFLGEPIPITGYAPEE